MKSIAVFFVSHLTKNLSQWHSNGQLFLCFREKYTSVTQIVCLFLLFLYLFTHPFIPPSIPPSLTTIYSISPSLPSRLTSSRARGGGGPSWKLRSGWSTWAWARGRWMSAAVSGGVSVRSRRPRTTRPSAPPASFVSFRGSPTPRTSSYSRRLCS